MGRTTRILGVLASTLVALTVVLGLTAPSASATASPTVDVVAHRGSSGAAPETTLAAVRLAIAQKSDVVENDIQRTLDGELVIMHDLTLARTTDVEQVFPNRAPWNVRDFTLAEIKQLDAGSWFAPEFAGERVPTLAEWFSAVGQQAGMLLEPKSPELYPGIETDLDKELRSLPEFNRALKAGRVVVQSFNHVWLRVYKDLRPRRPGRTALRQQAERDRHRRRGDLGTAGQPSARRDRPGHRRPGPRTRHGDPRVDRQRRR